MTLCRPWALAKAWLEVYFFYFFKHINITIPLEKIAILYAGG